MQVQGKIWIIYDAVKKVQSKPMSAVQAQVTLLSLVSRDLSKYFLWTPGWEEWTCLKDFVASEQTYFILSKPPTPCGDKPPSTPDEVETETTSIIEHTIKDLESSYTQVVVGVAPERSEDFGYNFQDFNGHELDLAKIKKNKPESTKKKIQSKKDDDESDRRRETRHNFKIEVVLVSKIRSFRTYSRNISLSGTMLEHEIPKDFLNTPFDLIIVNPFEANPTKARLLFRAKIVGDVRDTRRLMFIEQDSSMTLRLDALLKAYVAYQALVKKTTA